MEGIIDHGRRDKKMSSQEKGWKTGLKGKGVKEQDKGKVYKIIENVEWKSHPIFEKIRMKILLSHKEDQMDCTIFIQRADSSGLRLSKEYISFLLCEIPAAPDLMCQDSTSRY